MNEGDDSKIHKVLFYEAAVKQILFHCEDLLEAKYGSYFAAWKYALDRVRSPFCSESFVPQEQNGYVMKQDFCLTCRRLGVKEVRKFGLKS